MAEFYDHPETGKLHFRAVAGGHGGGATSMWDAPACEHDLSAHPHAMARYLKGKHAAKQSADAGALLAEEAKAVADAAAHVAADVAAQTETEQT